MAALTHFVNLTLNVAKLEQGLEGKERVTQTDIGWAVGQLIHSLHCAAGRLGWLTRAGAAEQAPVVQNRFAVAFPGHTEKGTDAQAGLGDFIRVFGCEADLRALLGQPDVRRMLLSGLFLWRREGVFAVADEDVKGYRRFYRVQPVTPAKDRRRAKYREEKGIPFVPRAGETCMLPYCRLPSISTRTRMTLFVGMAEGSPVAEGWANSYGLAVGGRENGLTGYPGVVLPVLE